MGNKPEKFDNEPLPIDCTICHDGKVRKGDVEKNLSILKCAHMSHFHFNCLLAWWRQNRTCPLCRDEQVKPGKKKKKKIQMKIQQESESDEEIIQQKSQSMAIIPIKYDQIDIQKSQSAPQLLTLGKQDLMPTLSKQDPMPTLSKQDASLTLNKQDAPLTLNNQDAIPTKNTNIAKDYMIKFSGIDQTKPEFIKTLLRGYKTMFPTTNFIIKIADSPDIIVPERIFEDINNIIQIELVNNDAAGNYLKEITSLNNLETLIINNCPKCSLPPDIKKLKKLKILDLRNTIIEYLPLEILTLNNLESIYINSFEPTDDNNTVIRYLDIKKILIKN